MAMEEKSGVLFHSFDEEMQKRARQSQQKRRSWKMAGCSV